MQHPDLTYASATSLQAARRAAADARRRLQRAQAQSDDEELPEQLLVAWMHLAGHGVRLAEEPAFRRRPSLELRGIPEGDRDDLGVAPLSGDAA